MSLKMKFRQKFKFAATSLLMLFGANSQVQAQQSTTAVMTVTAKIVSAPEFVSNIVTDITDQLQETREILSLGDYTVKFPKDVRYSIRFDPIVKMKGKTGSWDINTSVQENIDSEGNLILSLSGESIVTSVPAGQYTGQLTTQIDYD